MTTTEASDVPGRGEPSTSMLEVQLSESVLDTYRYLRGGTAVMVLMLAAAVIGESITAYCVLPSISAYYYTLAHNVFVAALCCIGVLLIVYRGGTDTEDNLLNLAGILAFIVAFVPTSPPRAGACGVDGSIVKSDLAIVNNASALVVALVVARVVFVAIRRIIHTKRPPRSALGWVTNGFLRAVLAAGIIGFFCFRREFYDRAHYAAAIVMFGAIILTVVISAFFSGNHDAGLAPSKRRYLWCYAVLAVVMLGTAVAVFVTHLLLDDWKYWVISVEALLIGEFAAYWLIQTVELWNVRSSKELLPPTLREDAVHTSAGGTPKNMVDEMRSLRGYPAKRRLMRAL